MSEPKDYTQLLAGYNESSKAVIEKVRSELNEDKILGTLEERYNVYDILMFTEFNLKERLEKNAFHYKDFRLKYLQECAKVEQIRDRLDKTIGEKYQSLKNGSVTLSKTEIEKYYLPVDVEIINLKASLRKQETIAKYFEAVCAAFDKQSWHMKSWLDQNGRGY